MNRAAIEYVRRGWSVIPVRARGKIPLVRWEPYQSRRSSEAEIEAWFRQWPDANIGVVTGEVSNLVVLDVDPQHGGAESLRELEQKNGVLPPTVQAVTGGGGRHLYFGFPLHPLRNRAGLAPGLDLRAEGGMVVVPPSVHPSGRAYQWAPGHDPGNCELAAMPLWLLRLAVGSPSGRGHSVDYWRTLVRTGVGEGVRNTTIASLAGYLLRRGIDPAVVSELLLCWNRVLCRPPLDDDEVARTVASISRLHDVGERI
jgi:hypothetical protein